MGMKIRIGTCCGRVQYQVVRYDKGTYIIERVFDTRREAKKYIDSKWERK